MPARRNSCGRRPCQVPKRRSLRLRRVGRNHHDPQLLQRPPHLRQAFVAHRPARRRSFKEVAGPIAVERAESPLPLDHFTQRRHHRACRFFLHPLRVVGLAGGVIQHLDQVVPAVVLEPLMAAPVQMQQHARQRPSRPPLAVCPALPPLLHQPRAMQRQLHPGVAQLAPSSPAPRRTLDNRAFCPPPAECLILRPPQADTSRANSAGHFTC